MAERATAVFEELGDDRGLAQAWRLAGQAHYLDRHLARCAEAWSTRSTMRVTPVTTSRFERASSG